MKTWEEIKEKINLEFVSKLCDYAEGYALIESDSSGIYYVSAPNGFRYSIEELVHEKAVLILSTLVNRTIEGWNNERNVECGNYFIHVTNNSIFTESGHDVIQRSGVEETEYEPVEVFDFVDYQPCHMTVHELAKIDCLLYVLT